MADDSSPSPRRFPALFFLSATVLIAIPAVRLWYATILPLAPDEVYYWQWSLSPALHYADHPPMIAWLIRAGTAVAGHTAMGIRLSSIGCGLLSALVTIAIARRLGFQSSRAVLLAGIASVLPMPATGAIMATPDAFLALCLQLMILLLIVAAQCVRVWPWLIMGLVTGLAIYTKHTAFLFFPLVLLATLITSSLRPALKTPWPFIGAALALVVSSPYLITEASSGFPALQHQSAHITGQLPGLASPWYLAPIRWLEVFLGQFGLLSPLVFIFAAMALRRPSALTDLERLLSTGVLIPLAATLFVATFTHAEQNWASLGHPLVVFLIWRLHSPVHRTMTMLTAALALTFTVVIHIHAVRPFLPLPVERDPVTRLHGWHELRQVSSLLSHADTVFCDNYGLAGELRFELRALPGLPPIVAADRPGQTPTNGNWLILDEQNDYGNAAVDTRCAAVTELPSIQLHRRDGETVRTIRTFRGTGCR